MVLIVDDKPENIISLKSFLELNAFEVDAAYSGEEALKKILKTSYELIILDVQMPVMDGFEVAEAISGYSKAKDIPIIFLSAVNIEKKFITKGYASGGYDYVTKPFDPDILLLKVRTFYKLYEQTRQLNQAHQELRREIEVRKKAELSLNEKVQELRSYLESIPQIAFTSTENGELEFVNEQWMEYSDSPHHFPETGPGEPNLQILWLQSIRKGEPVTADVKIKNLQTGEYRCHLFTTRPISNQQKITKWVGTLTDIHEQKMLNEVLETKVTERTRELSQMNKELEASNHDLQQFASVASHDLKEPLRKIQVFSTIIRDKYLNEDNNGMSSYVNRIINSSERMSGLITDLLSFSRLSVSSMFQKTDINHLIDEILDDLELSISEKMATIKVDEIGELVVIPGQIRQMFQNVISNALKFTAPGKAPEINITSSRVNTLDPNSEENRSGEYCRIIIKDNGIGFDEKYLNKIFTIFQRLNSPAIYEGTGIGLAIAKKIIDKHNGIITARSSLGEGASFIIILPVTQQKNP